MPYLIFMICLCLIACGSQPEQNRIKAGSPESTLVTLQQKLKSTRPNNVMVAAHRSCWSQGAPENSLAAIQTCIDKGVDIIEIDVRLTKDHIPVLLHDPTLDRTTSGNGKLNAFNWSDIQSLTLYTRKGGKNEYLTRQHIPTLRQALTLAKGKILINLDIKGNIYANAFSEVKKLKMEKQIIIKTDIAANDPNLIQAPYLGHSYFMPIIRQCVADIYRPVCSNKLSNTLAGYRPFDPVAYEITYAQDTFLLQAKAAIQQAGVRIWVNSLFPTHAAGLTDQQALKNPEKVWGHIIRTGASIIQTDYPVQLIQYLKNTGQG